MRSLLIFIILTLIGGSLQQRSPYGDDDDYKKLPDESKCGKGEAYRIYNGDDAELDDHPWYAILNMNKRGSYSRCGGSLINAQFILTAAHCFDDFRPSELQEIRKYVNVTLSEHKIGQRLDCEDGDDTECISAITVKVKKVIKHEKYKGKGDGFQNDIALVKLVAALGFNHGGGSEIKPICLPVRNDLRELNLEDENLEVAGFGRNGNKLSDIKKKTKLKVIKTTECQREFNNNPFKIKLETGQMTSALPIRINETAQICAKGENGADTCHGDSGGPLVFRNKYLMGIVSFGSDECGQGHYPAVFTRVSNFIGWIEKHMKGA